jgi:hypothetical protein
MGRLSHSDRNELKQNGTFAFPDAIEAVVLSLI